jgi:GT2 family glycosyltransferase
MSDSQPPADGPTILAPAGRDEPVHVPPPVVAVVVTHDAGPWLEDALASLTASDYPSLALFVLDAGSTEDPTPRVAAVAPHAFVRRLPENVGFAAAANEALAAVEGATFLLLCHDDVVVEAGAIRVMVEEAYRSNAGIVGPKMVAADDPEVLLEVGLTVDRFGIPFSGIEPGELDQEQHDTVRDVFVVSSAAMLVRTDLFHELGGFDPETWPVGEDLDLCWRALLVGARVMVAPDARVRHRRSGGGDADEPEDVGLRARHRIRSVLKSYSPLTLAWLVPVGVLLALVEALAYLIRGRPAQARAVVGAWLWNFRHLGSVLQARRAVQASRTVPDSDLRPLQVHGGEQLQRILTGRLHTDEALRNLGETSRSVVGAARSSMRQPISIGVLVFLFFVLLGSRDFISHRIPGIGSFLVWPGVGDLLRAYGSGWRSVDLGSGAPAPPALAAMAASGTVLLGATGLARTLVVVLALPVGALGAARLTRRFTRWPVARFAAAVAYGVNPVVRNALGDGRLGPLVLFAIAPFAVSVLIGLTEPRRDRIAVARVVLGLAVLVAVVGAFYPPALAFLILVAFAFLLAAPFVGGLRLAARALGYAVLATVVALVLLLPWSVSQLTSGDAIAWGAVFRPALGLADVLEFRTGPAGAGVVGWGLLAAAALALVVTTDERLAWAARAWMLALVGFAAVWLPARFASGSRVPAPEGVLVIAAVGISLAVGLGVSAFSYDLRTFHFGWRQLASVIAAIALALPVLGFLADSLDGSWHAGANDWVDTLSWTSSQSAGGFRLLIVGDPRSLPGHPIVQDGVGYSLLEDGTADARDLWPPRPRSGRIVGDALDTAASDRTNRLGHLLGPMGVRYVAVVDGRAPGDTSMPAPPRVADALDAQLDLTRLRTDGTYDLYSNDAWIPVRASAPGVTARSLRSSDPVAAGLTTELRGVRPLDANTRAAPGAVLWSQSYDSRWHASQNGRALPHVETFGWANGWTATRAGPVDVHYTGQTTRDLELVVQALLWIALVVAVWMLRPRRARRGARPPADDDRSEPTPEPALT